MLLCSTIEVRPSDIHGLGIFATAPIAKGVPISGWREPKDFKLSPDQWNALPEALRDFLYTYLWVGPDGAWYGSHDIARFTNHSNTPNMRWDEATKTTVAARYIDIGEELTENYEEFDHVFEDYQGELGRSEVPEPEPSKGTWDKFYSFDRSPRIG